MATVSVQLAQVAGRLEVIATWTLNPATAAQLALQLEAATGTGWAVVAAATPAATATQYTIGTAAPPLSAGQRLRARLRAVYATGTIAEGVSNEIVLSPGTTSTAGGGTVPVPVPAHDADYLADYGAAPDAGRRLAGRAAAAGAKYRSKFLQERAVAIAQQAISLEEQIASLQALDVAKMVAAQLIAAPEVASMASTIVDIGTATPTLPDLTVPIKNLGDAVQQLVLLQRIIDWLARTDILDFWYGLFSAIVDDVAHVDTELTRTRSYLRQAFLTPSLQSAVTGLIDDVKGQVSKRLEDMSGAIRGALNASTGAVTGEMRQLFASIDAPLVAAPPVADIPRPPSESDVLDANPLDLYVTDLRATVEKQIASIVAQAEAALSLLTGQDDLFVALMVGYVVMPVLAVVGIGLAGGPASAALLTGAVFIAGQELLHLIAKWLAGPIADQLAGLQARVDAAKAELDKTITGVAAMAVGSLGQLSQGTARLHVAGVFLRELSHLAPDAFLSATGELLSRQRDQLLRKAGELALAAEFAQGAENGTVFDAIRPDYERLAAGRLPRAAQLPGGSSNSRHAAETLLADLHRLDEQRLQLVDGKEMRLVKKISLTDVAGSAVPGIELLGTTPGLDPLTALLKGHPVGITLDEGDLLDGTHPGTYRALINNVRVLAYAVPPVSQSDSISLLVTHDGTSKVRVRRPGGATEGFGELAMRLLFSPEMVQRAYRRAIAGDKRFRSNSWTTAGWLSCMGRALWLELQAAAAQNELPDVSGMRDQFEKELRAIGVLSIVDPDTEDYQTHANQVFAHGITIFFGTWSGYVGSLDPAVGNGSIADPTVTTTESWAPGLAKLLRQRCTYLSTNPVIPFRKWGDHVRISEETEPALRGIGYQSIERRGEPQALATQLSPMKPAAEDPTGMIVFSTPDAPEGSSSIPEEQTRPFENLGLTGTFYVQLPDVADDSTGLLSGVGRKLRDLILEFDVRVVHDPDLEAAVRFSKSRARQLDGLVAGPDRGPLLVPGLMKTVAIRRGQRRTLQVSMRAQRHRSWIAWKQGVDAIKLRSKTDFLPAEGLVVADVDPVQALEPWEPFRLLRGNLTSFSVVFTAKPATTLGGLASELTIAPDQLGISEEILSVLPTMNKVDAGSIHSIGVAVVPSERSPAITSVGQGSVTIGKALVPLLGQPATWPLAGFRLTPYLLDNIWNTTGVSLKEVFEDPAYAYIKFDFGSDNVGAGWVYDIIVTITYTSPYVHIAPPTTEVL